MPGTDGPVATQADTVLSTAQGRLGLQFQTYDLGWEVSDIFPSVKVSNYDEGGGEPVPICTRGRHLLVDPETGEAHPTRCQRHLKCAWCAYIRREQLVLAIALAEPTFLFKVNHPGRDWRAVQRTVKRLKKHLTAHDNRLAMAYTVEQGSQPFGGTHLHAVARGAKPDRETFADALREAGAGMIGDRDLEDIQDPNAHFAYILKGIVKPGPRTWLAEAEVALWTHLALNGNRLIHSTQGFWRLRNGSPARLEDVIRGEQQRRNPSLLVRPASPQPPRSSPSLVQEFDA